MKIHVTSVHSLGDIQEAVTQVMHLSNRVFFQLSAKHHFTVMATFTSTNKTFLSVTEKLALVKLYFASNSNLN